MKSKSSLFYYDATILTLYLKKIIKNIFFSVIALYYNYNINSSLRL